MPNKTPVIREWEGLPLQKSPFRQELHKIFSKKIDYCQLWVPPIPGSWLWKQSCLHLHVVLNSTRLARKSNALTTWPQGLAIRKRSLNVYKMSPTLGKKCKNACLCKLSLSSHAVTIPASVLGKAYTQGYWTTDLSTIQSRDSLQTLQVFDPSEAFFIFRRGILLWPFWGAMHWRYPPRKTLG